MSITDRWTCLACGKFFNIQERPKYCPHCHDEYFCDNVVPGIPLELDKVDVECKCGLQFTVETGKDLKWCPRCGEGMKSDEGISLIEYQEKILEVLDL